MYSTGLSVARLAAGLALLFAFPANANTTDQLTKAIAHGDSAAVTRIVSSDKGREIATSMLVDRIRSGDSAAVGMLLDAGADKAIGSGQTSALMHAAQVGQLEIARLLLDRGADVNQRENALIVKPLNGQPPTTSDTYGALNLGKLNNFNADAYAGVISYYRLEESAGAGNSALSYAVAEKRVEVVKLLLQRGGDRNVTVVASDPEFAVVNVLENGGRKAILRDNMSLTATTTSGQKVFFVNQNGFVTTNSTVKPQLIIDLKAMSLSSGVPEIAALFK